MNQNQITDNLPRPGDLYYHYKHKNNDFTNHAYRILAIGVHTETGEELVIYEALYAVKETMKQSGLPMAVFVRPLSMFTEWLEYDGYEVQRFEKITNPAIIKYLNSH